MFAPQVDVKCVVPKRFKNAELRQAEPALASEAPGPTQTGAFRKPDAVFNVVLENLC